MDICSDLTNEFRRSDRVRIPVSNVDNVVFNEEQERAKNIEYLWGKNSVEISRGIQRSLEVAKIRCFLLVGFYNRARSNYYLFFFFENLMMHCRVQRSGKLWTKLFFVIFYRFVDIPDNMKTHGFFERVFSRWGKK